MVIKIEEPLNFVVKKNYQEYFQFPTCITWFGAAYAFRGLI